MSAYKCASCGGKDAKAYVVQSKQILCPACVGRICYPGTKEADFDIEELDLKKPLVHTLTGLLLQSSVVLGMIVALWNSGVSSDYFKGSSTCPTLSLGRQALARLDANVFYYYKSSLATYCDIEDSYWRLLLDGWMRGVVSGGDSVLLLFSTLPKAMLFKSAVNTLLKPVYGVLYALAGLFLSTIIGRIESGVQRVFALFPSRSVGWMQSCFRIPKKLESRAKTKDPRLNAARQAFVALSAGALLRFAVHYAGFRKLAALSSTQEADVWQLLFEPVAFYAVALFLGNIQAKLDKTWWKKAPPPPPINPVTFWRMKPGKDINELMDYARARFWRTYEAYQKQAADLLSIMVDDVFNAAIVLRLLSILLGAGPYLRHGLSAMGLSSIVRQHAALFQEATGFVEDGGKYLSDHLLHVGLGEAVVALQAVRAKVDLEVFGTKGDLMSSAHTIVWRAFVPLMAFIALKYWERLKKKQQGNYKKSWKGQDWTNGGYADMLEKVGAFWNKVQREEWRSPATVYASAK